MRQQYFRGVDIIIIVRLISAVNNNGDKTLGLVGVETSFHILKKAHNPNACTVGQCTDAQK